ncbi:MAG: phosphomannomutase/phosphoglucomutase [Candidatus Diapherotrites archaeon]
MNKEIFREYDIRGIADKELTNEVVEKIGKAYGTIIKKKGGKEIIVGNDNRTSSKRITKKLIEGIISTGVNVIKIGQSTTPQLYFAVNFLKKDGGVNVTGSHNPPEYNGFKVLVGNDAIHGKEIQELREIAEKEEFVKGKGKIKKKSIEKTYLKEIVKRVKVKRKVKLVIDAGNGMASELAPKLFEMLGCETTKLFCEKIENYPNHIPDPSQEKNVKELQKKVVEEKAELGIAFDGDVDRIGIVDEKGNLIFGDKLLGILAKKELEKKPGAKIIMEVKCSQGLEEWIKNLGGIPIIWKTGHSLIKAKMREEKAILAGEMSGHMFFANDWYGFDDALLAAAKVIEIVSSTSKKVSELVEEQPKYFASPEYRVDFSDKEKFEFVEKAKKHFSKNYKVIDIDGARVLFENGWALIRASNTQPKLIIRMEGKTKQDLEQITKNFVSELNKIGKQEIKLTE